MHYFFLSRAFLIAIAVAVGGAMLGPPIWVTLSVGAALIAGLFVWLYLRPGQG